MVKKQKEMLHKNSLFFEKCNPKQGKYYLLFKKRRKVHKKRLFRAARKIKNDFKKLGDFCRKIKMDRKNRRRFRLTIVPICGMIYISI